MALPVVQARGLDRGRRTAPVGSGARDDHGAVLELDLELGQERQRVAVAGGGAPVETQPTAEPAVGQPAADRVGARHDQVGDVVGVVAQALRVRRPAGAEHVVADTSAVDLELVDATGRDVEPGPPVAGRDLDLPAQPVGLEVLALLGAGRDRGGGPVGRHQQAGLELGGGRPPAGGPVGRAQAGPDAGALARAQRSPRPGQQGAVAETPGGLVDGAVALDLQLPLVRRPAGRRPLRAHARAGPRLADAERIAVVLHAGRGEGHVDRRAAHPFTAPEARPFMTLWLRNR